MGAHRGRYQLAVLALLAIAAGATWFVLSREPDYPLGSRNYRRITPGMTRDDVAHILGGPPGPIGRVPEPPTYMGLVEQDGPTDPLGGLEGKPEIWYSDRGQIIVTFDTWDGTGRVVGKQLYRAVTRR